MFCYLNICRVTSFWIHNKNVMSKPHDIYFCLSGAPNLRASDFLAKVLLIAFAPACLIDTA